MDGAYHRLENNSAEYRFTLSFDTTASFESDSLVEDKEFYVGHLSDEGNTLSGIWGNSGSDVKNPFLFKRISPDILVARPSPAAFRENKTRALWNYAITAALNEARRKLFTWSYIKERRDRRIECLSMLDREDDSTSENSDDRDAEHWERLNRLSTYEEAQSFFALNHYMVVYT